MRLSSHDDVPAGLEEEVVCVGLVDMMVPPGEELPGSSVVKLENEDEIRLVVDLKMVVDSSSL